MTVLPLIMGWLRSVTPSAVVRTFTELPEPGATGYSTCADEPPAYLTNHAAT